MPRSRTAVPKTTELLTDAAAALAAGDFETAALNVNTALDSDHVLRRAARNAPKTAEQLMPLLRRKTEAGLVLLQLRRSLGKSQSEMAAICGVTKNYIGQVEIGRQSMSEAAITTLFQWMAESASKTVDDGLPPPVALLKLRRLLGMSPFALATKLGVKEAAIRRMETGSMPISPAVADAYRQLASERGFDLDQLADAA